MLERYACVILLDVILLAVVLPVSLLQSEQLPYHVGRFGAELIRWSWLNLYRPAERRQWRPETRT